MAKQQSFKEYTADLPLESQKANQELIDMIGLDPEMPAADVAGVVRDFLKQLTIKKAGLPQDATEDQIRTAEDQQRREWQDFLSSQSDHKIIMKRD